MEDVKKLAWKICASFKVPAVRCEVLRGQVFKAPPAPKCINRNMFLPDDLPYQDIWLKPYQMTLAYAQTLQYWAEEANPPSPNKPHLLVMSVHKLTWCMGKHTTFHDHDVFEGLANDLPRAMVKDTQPSPTGSSPAGDLTTSSSGSKAESEEDTQPSRMGNLLVDDPTTSSSLSEADVMEDIHPGPAGMPLVDPTISTAMFEVEDTQPSLTGTPLVDDPTVPSAVPKAVIREDLSAAWSASPVRMWEDLVALTAAWADQLTNPPTLASSMGNEWKEYPKWIKVHSSHKAAAVGSIPCNPRESWCHHGCSSRWQKRTYYLLKEEWWDLGDVSRSNPSEGSPEPILLSKEDKSVEPKE